MPGQDFDATPEPADPEVEGLLEEPDPHGDLVDALLLGAAFILIVAATGGLYWFLQAMWHQVGLGE